MSKSQSASSHHGGAKTAQTARPQSVLSAAMAKALTTSDEFKHGFPSEGLSTASNRWWGSDSVVEHAGAPTPVTEEKEEERADDEGSGTGLLMAVRKKVAEQGREAIKLGAFKGCGNGYGGNSKVGKKERALLLRIFDSSAPREWLS